jgi:hypothetical protein
MVAAFDDPRVGHPPRLRIKRLLPEQGPWEEVPISPYINSVFFGVQGKHLLLTEVIDESLQSVLVSWDMEQRDTPPTLLYKGYRLVFPMEIKPGHYLVRSCNNERADWPCTQRVFSWQWEWIHNGQNIQVFNRKDQDEPLLYGQPTVVGERGFFWFTNYKGLRFITLSFRGQQLEPPSITFDENTRNIKCDRKAERCLERFIQGVTEDRKFIYAFRVHYQGRICPVPGIAGFGDAYSLTPDGLAAVSANASGSYLPRTVVVMRFQPGQCAPIAVQFLPFEESRS